MNARHHESATGHVTGRATYSDDQRWPADMLSVWPVMAPYAHARITRLEPSGAHDVPGVVTVLTAQDVPGENDSGPLVHDEVLIPQDKVLYWGQAVAWVVATSMEAARRGADKVEVEYEPLEALLSIEAAIATESYHGEPQRMARGEVDAALRQAALTFEGECTVNGQDHFYLETQTSWALPDSEGAYQVYASTQHPSETQAVVARVLGIPKNRVVVTCLRMGGGFGGKESQANPYAALAALAAWKTGKPARVRLNREQDMVLTGKRHGFLGRYRVGYQPDGRVTALELTLYSDGGWSSDLSLPVMQRAMFHSDNAYYIPHMQVTGRVCKTNKVSNTAFRGFGGPQGMLIIEDIVDRVARTLGLPPELVRERNFYHGSGETATTHYGQEISDNRIWRVWQEVKANAQFETRKQALSTQNKKHPYKKRGLAVTPVKFGISFTNTPMNQAGAFVLIYLDGSVQLNHGGTEMGQGLHTKMRQVAARTLGIEDTRIRLMPTATDKVPNTSPTAASSGADLNGQAVKGACETLKQRLAGIAAKMLELNAPEELVFEEGWIYPPGEPSRKLPFAEVAGRAYQEQVSLSATGYYRTPNIYFNKLKGSGRPFHYYAYGAAVSEVEVDGFTGQWKLKRVDIVHDVGNSLNALIDRGQIEGGFVQGVGWLTTEELVWDDQGKFLTSAPSTYKIPTIAEVPETFNVRMLERAAQEGVIYGSKAVGEPPLMLALSVREAIRDAIAAFGHADHLPLASPATPEAILNAIEQVKREAKASNRGSVPAD